MIRALQSVYRGMNAVSNVICKILGAIIVLLVVVNAGDVFLQVFNRYILVKISNLSFSWTDELARYSMIWICYCTLGICFREGSMAQVDIIYGRLGHRGRLVLYSITRLLMAMVLYVSIRYGLYVCEIKQIYKSAMLNAPGLVLYSAPVVGSFLVGFEMATEFVGVMAKELTPFEAGEKRGFPGHNEPEEQMPDLPSPLQSAPSHPAHETRRR